MTLSDPIADMLSRIRNAILVNKAETVVPYSKLKESVAKLLMENGFIVEVSTQGEKLNKQIVLKLSAENSKSVITEINRLSKPGRRLYVNSTEIPVIRRGRGIVIVSTSKGVMTGESARQQNVGGELICSIY